MCEICNGAPNCPCCSEIRYEICPECDGTGLDEEGLNCSICDGHGSIDNLDVINSEIKNENDKK